jgi:hypothetical protein
MSQLICFKRIYAVANCGDHAQRRQRIVPRNPRRDVVEIGRRRFSDNDFHTS